MAKNNGQPFPVLTLNINYTGGSSTTVDDTLFLEPPYQNPVDGNPACSDQGKTVLDTWQRWDVLHGCWWSNTANFGPPVPASCPSRSSSPIPTPPSSTPAATAVCEYSSVRRARPIRSTATSTY